MSEERTDTNPEAAAPPAHEIRNLSLHLIEVRDNARVHETPSEDATLEASIRHSGLLQPLVVSLGKNGNGSPAYVLISGHRRLAALKAIHGPNAKVAIPCILTQYLHRYDDLEAAFAENAARAGLHPADEALAMQALIEAGADIADVALHFALSERQVRRVRAYSKLDPRILDEFRAGACSAGVAAALTRVSRKHGWKIYQGLPKRLRRDGHIDDYRIRDAVMQDRTTANDRRALFVGLDAYRAAGGKTVEDLFASIEEAGGEHIILTNVALLDRLAEAKLREHAEAAELYGAEPVVAIGKSIYDIFPYQHWERVSWPRKNAKGDVRKDHRVFFGLNHDGTVDMSEPHLPTKLARERERAARRKASSEAVESGREAPADAERYSQALRAEMAAEWTGALQRHLAAYEDPDLAFDAMVFLLSHAIVHYSFSTPSALNSALRWMGSAPLPDAPESMPPETRGSTKRRELGREFAAFRQLPNPGKERLAAHILAGSLEAVLPGSARSDLLEELAADTGFDMAAHWVPDTTFFKRCSKETMLDLMRECGVPAERMPDPDMKKGALAKACGELAAEYRIVLPEHRVPDRSENRPETDGATGGGEAA